MFIIKRKSDIKNIRLSKNQNHITRFIHSYFLYLSHRYGNEEYEVVDLSEYCGEIFLLERETEWDNFTKFHSDKPITKDMFVSSTLIKGSAVKDVPYINSVLYIKNFSSLFAP